MCYHYITRRVPHPNLAEPRQKQGTLYRVFEIRIWLCLQKLAYRVLLVHSAKLQ